ncbi:hypothetical protein MSG28_011653 [Choristoneura fumiferana]|nr:hypothetical protein MSG28_011653 [Choristoneura fumiferana]
MTSKANPGTCRYAYPDCPNDPEELVHYLNNHNGGFFRFFAAPQLNQQQGLEQFYNQLSGQNYGYYQPQQNLEQAGYGQLQQNYQYQQLQGAYPQQQGVYQGQNLQQQGLYQNQNVQQQALFTVTSQNTVKKQVDETLPSARAPIEDENEGVKVVFKEVRQQMSSDLIRRAI